MAGEYLLLVFSNPVEGHEDSYNDWYDRVHAPDVLRVPGVVSGQRYRLATSDDVQPKSTAHRYLAVYELDRDPGVVLAELMNRLETGEMALSDTLDLDTVEITTWRLSGSAQENLTQPGDASRNPS